MTVITPDGPFRALTFAIIRNNERYARRLPLAETAQMIRSGKGSLGTCRSYFDSTLQTQKLREIGVIDSKMDRLRRAILEEDAADLDLDRC